MSQNEQRFMARFFTHLQILKKRREEHQEYSENLNDIKNDAGQLSYKLKNLKKFNSLKILYDNLNIEFFAAFIETVPFSSFKLKKSMGAARKIILRLIELPSPKEQKQRVIRKWWNAFAEIWLKAYEEQVLIDAMDSREYNKTSNKIIEDDYNQLNAKVNHDYNQLIAGKKAKKFGRKKEDYGNESDWDFDVAQ